jgi:hypothetical protein
MPLTEIFVVTLPTMIQLSLIAISGRMEINSGGGQAHLGGQRHRGLSKLWRRKVSSGWLQQPSLQERSRQLGPSRIAPTSY